jgi:hypothetical protein
LIALQNEMNEWNVGAVIAQAGNGENCHEKIAAELKKKIHMMQV